MHLFVEQDEGVRHPAEQRLKSIAGQPAHVKSRVLDRMQPHLAVGGAACLEGELQPRQLDELQRKIAVRATGALVGACQGRAVAK